MWNSSAELVNPRGQRKASSLLLIFGGKMPASFSHSCYLQDGLEIMSTMLIVLITCCMDAMLHEILILISGRKQVRQEQ